jgi:hypothetical protein
MKRFILAIALAAVASIIVAGTASADVARNQPAQTATFTVTQPAGQVGQWDNVWTHNFTVTVNGDGSFTGTGTETGQDQGGPGSFTETVTGKFNADSTVSLQVQRDDGVMWALENAVVGGKVNLGTTLPQVNWVIEMKVSAPVFGDTYKNHGDYVSSQGGGSEAAHSAIGMPLNSNSGK